MFNYILATYTYVWYDDFIKFQGMVGMYKTYKFRLYPNKKQVELLNKSFGCSRFIYNHYLNKIKNDKYYNAYSNILDYTSNLKYISFFTGSG